MASHQEGDTNENILHGSWHNFISFRRNRYRTAHLADHTIFAAGCILPGSAGTGNGDRMGAAQDPGVKKIRAVIRCEI